MIGPGWIERAEGGYFRDDWCREGAGGVDLLLVTLGQIALTVGTVENRGAILRPLVVPLLISCGRILRTLENLE